MSLLRVSGIALVVGMASPAGARAAASVNLDTSGFYVPFGINVGAALRSQGRNGWLLGGGISPVYFWHDDTFAFLGGYADYLRDFGAGFHRISFGGGAHLCGVDGGSVIELGHGTSDIGWCARVFGSLAFVTLYAGEGYRPAGGASWSTEIGLLIKVPTLHSMRGEGFTFDL